jgi:hypothetical protein
MALSWVSFGQICVISPLHSTSGKFFVKLRKKKRTPKNLSAALATAF